MLPTSVKIPQELRRGEADPTCMAGVRTSVPKFELMITAVLNPLYSFRSLAQAQLEKWC